MTVSSDQTREQLEKACMNRVIIESPYAGDIEANLTYLRSCMRDSLMRGEAPFASHALYTQPGVLDDGISDERRHGIEAGFAWRRVASKTIFYLDYGVSSGMREGYYDAKKIGHFIEYRSLALSNIDLRERIQELTRETEPNATQQARG